MLSPKLLLRLEGLAVGAAAVIAYRVLGASWKEFALLILAPDLSMVGFALGKGAGTACYNVVHSYAVVGLAWLIGYYACHWSGTSAVCLVWLVHIGADRLLGFGLKYPDAFKDTHLQRV